MGCGQNGRTGARRQVGIILRTRLVAETPNDGTSVSRISTSEVISGSRAMNIAGRTSRVSETHPSSAAGATISRGSGRRGESARPKPAGPSTRTKAGADRQREAVGVLLSSRERQDAAVCGTTKARAARRRYAVSDRRPGAVVGRIKRRKNVGQRPDAVEPPTVCGAEGL